MPLSGFMMSLVLLISYIITKTGSISLFLQDYFFVGMSVFLATRGHKTKIST